MAPERALFDDDLSVSKLLLQEPDRYRTWVQIGAFAAAVGFAASLVIGLFVTPTPYPVSEVIALAIILAAMVVIRGPRIEVGAYMVIAAVWGEIIFSHFVGGATGVTAASGLPALVIGVGLLLGAKAALLTALVTGIAVPVALIGHEIVFGPAGMGANEIRATVTLEVALAGTAVLIAIGLRSLGSVYAQARANRERYEDLFMNAPDGMLIVSEQGAVLDMNPAAESLLGGDASRVSASGFERLMPTGQDSDASGIREVWWERPDGRRVALETTLRRVDVAADSGVQLMIRDVTERARAAEAQAELRDKLQQAQKMEAVGELAGGVAHDFNNLLTVVSATIELLGGQEDEETTEILEQLRTASERGAALNRRLLTFARRDIVQPRPLNAVELVDDVHPLLQRLAGPANEVDILSQGDRRAMVTADAGQLEQILVNLVANARDALPGGGHITVTVDARAEDVVRFGVKDDGAGMSPEVLERAFEPFYTTKGREQATGLGLSTIHGIVTRNGGTVQVDTAPGRGTEVWVSWPRGRDAGPEVHDVRSTTEEVDRPIRVLVVEDDKAARTALLLLLRRAGFEVLGAEDGEDGLEKVEAESASIDVVLSDIVMPGMSGVDLGRVLRERYPELPIVFMSGYVDDRLRPQMEASGVTEVMTKPFTSEELVERINAAVGARRVDT